MTLSRLLLCTLALAPAACATHAQTAAPVAPHYKLCTDPQFECVAPEVMPIRVDTNLTTPGATRTALS